MDDLQRNREANADDELKREIRRERKFTLAAAIGELAGPGMMKGISPITGLRQATAQIQEILIRHLTDASGALATVLLRQVENSDVLLHGFDQPIVALANYVDKIIDSEFHLSELVREADVEWGKVFGERPYFETAGRTPASHDPYTLESVRLALSQLKCKLAKEPMLTAR